MNRFWLFGPAWLGPFKAFLALLLPNVKFSETNVVGHTFQKIHTSYSHSFHTHERMSEYILKRKVFVTNYLNISSHSFLQPITIDIKIKIRKVSENMHNVFRIFVFPPGPDRRWWKRFPQLTWCASPFSESRKPDIINLYLGAQSSFSSMNCNQNNVDGSADHIIMLGDFVFCIHIIIIFLESSPECPRPCW